MVQHNKKRPKGTKRREDELLAIRFSNRNERASSNAPPTDAQRIEDSAAWIGRFADGRMFDQEITYESASLLKRPVLELAPTSSLVDSVEQLGKDEFARRIAKVKKSKPRPFAYHAGEFGLKIDEWSTLLVAIPTEDTLEAIRRDLQSTHDRISVKPPDTSGELVIGCFTEQSSAQTFLDTIALSNRNSAEPLYRFGASRPRDLHL